MWHTDNKNYSKGASAATSDSSPTSSPHSHITLELALSRWGLFAEIQPLVAQSLICRSLLTSHLIQPPLNTYTLSVVSTLAIPVCLPI